MQPRQQREAIRALLLCHHCSSGNNEASRQGKLNLYKSRAELTKTLQKEEILDHIQRIYLPYTVIDVGWWYKLTVLRVPSGKLDHGLAFPNNNIIAGGNTPSALLNVLDMGKYVAAIIDDPRTINKKVLADTEAKMQNEVHELVDKVTGEKPECTEVSQNYQN